ncbi:hypothetical protein Tco_0923155 [Tanacetum coccineum]|uniref:Uncharacterized protein n=1 Tax=Tanacetum coccineum TaxID=301880 RepID=A0ABQ5D076_9ASTR
METKDVHAMKYKMSKAKERCMAYFCFFHSYLQVLSKEDLKGTRIEHGFKRAFLSLFGQDSEAFTSTMVLNVDQLQKLLDKDEFQEDGSMAAFRVLNRQFQQFIDSHVTLDYDGQMTDKYFVTYTRIKVKQFRETLLQHMGNVKKSVDERTRHQRQYNRRQDINAFRAQRIANTHDPLALMSNTQTPFHPDQLSHITYIQHPQPNNNFVPQPSFNTNYMPQPMQNLEDSSDPTTAMNKALALLAKAFKICQNQYGNGNVVTTLAKGNGNGINGNPIRCQSSEQETGIFKD